MDDFFGWDFEENLELFHGELRPKRQVSLLRFWDLISCPYEDKKQLHGSLLKIIGFWVNVNMGSISIPPSAILEAIEAISTFLAHRKSSLREWSRLAGHLNWILNVFAIARPALTELYRKMSGKKRPNGLIPLNAEAISDLNWFKEVLPHSLGVHFVDNGRWLDSAADLIIHCDATLTTGIAFVCGQSAFCYSIHPPLSPSHSPDIFLLEEIGVLSSLFYAASLPSPPQRLVIFCDNLDTVQCFGAMRASDSMHNGPLLAAANIFLSSGIDFRVRYIAGKDNTEADLVSRILFEDFAQRFRKRVHTFDPPRDLLPARWRDCF